jgi:hypothetical protein
MVPTVAFLAWGLVPQGTQQRKHGHAVDCLKELLRLDTLDSLLEERVTHRPGRASLQAPDLVHHLRLQ